MRGSPICQLLPPPQPHRKKKPVNTKKRSQQSGGVGGTAVTTNCPTGFSPVGHRSALSLLVDCLSTQADPVVWRMGLTKRENFLETRGFLFTAFYMAQFVFLSNHLVFCGTKIMVRQEIDLWMVGQMSNKLCSAGDGFIVIVITWNDRKADDHSTCSFRNFLTEFCDILQDQFVWSSGQFLVFFTVDMLEIHKYRVAVPGDGPEMLPRRIGGGLYTAIHTILSAKTQRLGSDLPLRENFPTGQGNATAASAVKSTVLSCLLVEFPGRIFVARQAAGIGLAGNNTISAENTPGKIGHHRVRLFAYRAAMLLAYIHAGSAASTFVRIDHQLLFLA